MFNDNDIENLIQPIISRQDDINLSVLNTIANRVREIGKLSPSDVKRLKIMAQMGADIRALNGELAKLSNLQVRDIKSMIRTVAQDSYIDAKYLYDYRHKPFKSFEKNTPMQQLVTAIGNATAQNYLNISNSKAIGFLIGPKFRHRGLHFQPIRTTYAKIIDEAIQATKSGLLDYRVAMRRALKQLSDSGVRRLSWESGYTQRLDTAVRRNVLDGIHAIQQAIEDEIGKQIGADAKELSVHMNCALDHEPIQGHIFKNEEYEKLQSADSFQDIDGNSFEPIERAIGTWNCRHFAYSFIIGLSKPRYSKRQLQEYIRNNHKGYALPNGKQITMYECTQIQRQLETKVRYAKEEQMMWLSAGDREQALVLRAKVKSLTNEYKIFSKDCGLTQSPDRLKVSEYKSNF